MGLSFGLPLLRYGVECSLKLGHGVSVSLEGTVDDVCAIVVEVGHDWLALGSVPRNVSWLSHSVSVGGSVVLVIDGGLSGSPLSVGIGHRRVSGEHPTASPPEEVWVVHERLGVELIVVEHDGSVGEETTAQAPDHEVDAVGVGEPASHVEVSDGQLSDHQETEGYSELGAGGVGGPVEVGLVDGAGDDVVHVLLLEPAAKLKHTIISNHAIKSHLIILESLQYHHDLCECECGSYPN